MELLACIKVLEWIRENRPWPSVNRVQILTDSNYVIENLTICLWPLTSADNRRARAEISTEAGCHRTYSLWRLPR